MKIIKKFISDEKGDVLQYLVVGGIMTLAFFVVWKLVQPGINTQFTKVQTELSQ